jgi:hypothetical protein
MWWWAIGVICQTEQYRRYYDGLCGRGVRCVLLRGAAAAESHIIFDLYMLIRIYFMCITVVEQHKSATQTLEIDRFPSVEHHVEFHLVRTTPSLCKSTSHYTSANTDFILLFINTNSAR